MISALKFYEWTWCTLRGGGGGGGGEEGGGGCVLFQQYMHAGMQIFSHALGLILPWYLTL